MDLPKAPTVTDSARISHFLFIFCLQIDYASCCTFFTKLQPMSVCVYFTQFTLISSFSPLFFSNTLFLHTSLSHPLFVHELENQPLSYSHRLDFTVMLTIAFIKVFSFLYFLYPYLQKPMLHSPQTKMLFAQKCETELTAGNT